MDLEQNGDATTPSQNAAQEQKEASPEDRAGADNDQRRPSADFAALIDAIGREGQANRDEESREDRGKKFRDYLTLFFVMATAGGVLYQAYIFSGQLNEMKTAGSQTDKLIDTNAKLAEAAGKQADAAQKQAQALTDSAAVAHDNMILAERAWVGPTNASFGAEPAIGKPIEITVTYQNSGRQPALNFVPLMEVFAVTDQEDKAGITDQRTRTGIQNCINTKEWAGGSVAFPSTGFSNFTFFTKTKDDFVDDNIVKGTKAVVVQGCFLYRTFGAPHHSYFCFFYKGGGVTKIQNLNICAGGHAAD